MKVREVQVRILHDCLVMHAGATKVGDVRTYTKFHGPVSWLAGYSSVNWVIWSVLAECIT